MEMEKICSHRELTRMDHQFRLLCNEKSIIYDFIVNYHNFL